MKLVLLLKKLMGAFGKVLVVSLAVRFFLVLKRSRNTITFGKDKKIAKVARYLKDHLATYVPPVWIPTGSLQTLSTEFILKPELPLRRETIRLPELIRDDHGTSHMNVCAPRIIPEGIVSIDWLDVEDQNAPIAIIVPGLTGDSNAGYVRRVGEHLWKDYGFRVACYNPRGRGGNELISPFLYSVGYTEDLRRIIAQIKQTHPNADVMAAGFSLGSNYLAKYCGEEGDNNPLKAAVCLACPIDCQMISNALEESIVGKYFMNPALVASVKRVANSIEHILGKSDLYDLEDIQRSKTMHEFDDRAIAPMFEFDSASDYYRWSSCGLFLSKIRRPVLFLHAANDPIIDSVVVSKSMDNFRNDYLLHCMTREGGHSMDWPTTTLQPWSAKIIAQFFTAVRKEYN